MTEGQRPWFTYFIPPPALAIAFVVIGLFAFAYWNDPRDDTLKGALIGAFAGAWGYYLGSSKGAADNREQLNKTQDKLLAAAPTKGSVSLGPGERVSVEAEDEGNARPV